MKEDSRVSFDARTTSTRSRTQSLGRLLSPREQTRGKRTQYLQLASHGESWQVVALGQFISRLTPHALTLDSTY